jgi:hypothetical protein
VQAWVNLVARYLALVEARDFHRASQYLAPGARLVFPGGVVYSSLDEMSAAAASRYRWVRKRVERWDVVEHGRTKAVVYCLGTLEGETPDRRPFRGVRFVDRFVVEAGLVVLHEVWNDLAEHGIVSRSGPGV